MKKTVLAISYYFPPVGSVATLRTTKFIRYLGDYDWQVVVLTVRSGAEAARDETLLRQLPADLPIYRTRAIQPTGLYFALKRSQNAAPQAAASGSAPPAWYKRLLHSAIQPVRIAGRTLVERLLIPDDQVGWIPFAVPAGEQIIHDHAVDLIYTTCSPFSTNSVGRRLARKTGLPWVADFRDPFLNKNPAVRLPRYQERLHERLERGWIETADRVISVTKPMVDTFLKRYPAIPKQKWALITNGYDEEDFVNRSTAQPTECFELRYVGSLYRGVYPSMTPLLEAVADLLARVPEARRRFRLSFIGNVDNTFQQDIAATILKLGIQERVSIQPPVAHGEALALICSASALIVTHSREANIALHVKIFEYLRAHKPILGLLPPGAARDLLVTMDSTALILPEDREAIARQLELWFVQWQNGVLPRPLNPGIEHYERRVLTGQLAQLFDEVLEERQP